jgi:hypothetical protein
VAASALVLPPLPARPPVPPLPPRAASGGLVVPPLSAVAELASARAVCPPAPPAGGDAEARSLLASKEHAAASAAIRQRRGTARLAAEKGFGCKSSTSRLR